MLLLLALALAESEVYNMTDRHDRVQLCTRVVKDKAVRDKKQLLEDVDFLMSEELTEAAEGEAEKAEKPQGDTAEAGDSEKPASNNTRNLTAAVTEWTKRAMTACMLNAQETDVED